MSKDNLRDTYRDAAFRHGSYTISGDYRNTNKAYKDIVAVLRKIRNLDDRGLELLRDLTYDEDLTVRVWSASHLLPLDEKWAIRVLEEISSLEIGHSSLDAEMTLSEWRSGRLTID